MLISDCTKKCGFDLEGTVVAPQEKEECMILVPDLPKQGFSNTFPCQIHIEANCTTYCHVHLNFIKFTLPPCDQNLTETAGVCDLIDR